MKDLKPLITFYDIASAPPSRTFAPNPWKTRLALNSKGIDYQTQPIHLPKIPALRSELGVAANRTGPDGAPFFTLPVIKDESTGEVVGDSFEIALYLDKAFPDAPRLIRPLTTGLVASFNARVDSICTSAAILCERMPFPSESLEETLAIFAKRAGSMGVDLQMTDEGREAIFTNLENELGQLAKAYQHTGANTDHFWKKGAEKGALKPPPGRDQVGPWLDVEGPFYEDFIIGAWLKMFQATMRPEDWERVSKFQDGLWGKIVDALEPYCKIV